MMEEGTEDGEVASGADFVTTSAVNKLTIVGTDPLSSFAAETAEPVFNPKPSELQNNLKDFDIDAHRAATISAATVEENIIPTPSVAPVTVPTVPTASFRSQASAPRKEGGGIPIPPPSNSLSWRHQKRQGSFLGQSSNPNPTNALRRAMLSSTAASPLSSSPTMQAPLSQPQPQPQSISPPAVPMQTFEAFENYKYLTGEQVQLTLKDTYMSHPSGRLIGGLICMTNFRIIFVPSDESVGQAKESGFIVPDCWLQIPLSCIEKLEKEKKQHTSIKSNNITILITCKDLRTLRISMLCKPSTVIPSPTDRISATEQDIEKALVVMFTWIFPSALEHVFAFAYGQAAAKLFERGEPYGIASEMSRLGLLENEDPLWRISGANSEFALCDSYPRALIVPKSMSDEDLKVVSQFRSGGRLPTLCWGSKATGATMWRSSQPKGGINGSSPLDEKYLDIIAKSSTYHEVPPSYFEPTPKSKEPAPLQTQSPAQGFQALFRTQRSTISLDKVAAAAGIPHDVDRRHLTDDDPDVLMIIDCRPRTNALANRAAGAGYEASSNYPSARLDFYNIGNIHVMRDSIKSLRKCLAGPDLKHDLDFGKGIEETQWLTHVRMVLKAGWDCAHFISKGYPVLVHCSHGWDRTPQVTALGQLLLDPFYRTFEGFRILVEKEWLSFGHQFTMRCQQIRQKGKEEEVSPIFHQFLDCVWQILNQYPLLFEFNARYLLVLADSIYSGRFGTFLADTDMMRDTLEIDRKCIAVWDYLWANRSVLENPLYAPETGPTAAGVLIPPLSQFLRKVTIWSDYYYRWNELSTFNSTPGVSVDVRAGKDGEDEEEENGVIVSHDTAGEQDLPKSDRADDTSADFSIDLTTCSLRDRMAVFERAFVEERKEKEKLMACNEELSRRVETLLSALGEKGLELHREDLLTK